MRRPAHDRGIHLPQPAPPAPAWLRRARRIKQIADASMSLPDQRLAFIGIGKIGLPIAARLAKAGYDVTAFDRNAERLDEARGLGIVAATSATEAVRDQAAVVSSLPDDTALRAAMLGDGGLIAAMTPGTILIETSTVGVEASNAVATAAEPRAIAYLRTPVSGNASIAHTGELTCFVSGPKEAFARVTPLLASFTRAQTYLGSAEEARYAKLAVNLMIATTAAMMAESLALARKGGIAWPDILQVLHDSAVASPMVKYKTAPLLARDFAATFSCAQMAKDLDLILGAGHAVGVPLQLAAQVRETYVALIAQGDAETDFLATVRHVERLSGLGEPV
ncbi:MULTISPECIES: NAD(P)-dependent oxidoreductase [unclassified Bradyrhizobium]|uniref:NAD(P)-dependent oxidoreductase n=1 Tax=unclassified Bradyrhizobium TaxID=2631580 RepID=UPI0028EFBD9A|nr:MULTISPECIES: NAD(P)-dependent oxidoreductase [unclassified Bradyrhizobium]